MVSFLSLVRSAHEAQIKSVRKTKFCLGQTAHSCTTTITEELLEKDVSMITDYFTVTRDIQQI